MPDPKSPQDASSATDPTAVYAPHAGVTAVPMIAWAKVKDGKIEEMKVVANYLPHPYPDHEANGGRVINITAVPCAVGYVVDTHGNAAPPATMTADGIVMAPSMPAPGAQAAAVQAAPVADKAITPEEMNERRAELVAAAEPPPPAKPAAPPPPPPAPPTPVKP